MAAIKWECLVCTLENTEPALVCLVCNTKRGDVVAVVAKIEPSVYKPASSSSSSSSSTSPATSTTTSPVKVAPVKPKPEPEPSLDGKYVSTSTTGSSSYQEALVELFTANGFDTTRCKVFINTLDKILSNMINLPQQKSLRRFFIQRDSFQHLFGPIKGSVNCLIKFGYDHTFEAEKEILVYPDKFGAKEIQVLKVALKWGLQRLEQHLTDTLPQLEDIPNSEMKQKSDPLPSAPPPMEDDTIPSKQEAKEEMEMEVEAPPLKQDEEMSDADLAKKFYEEEQKREKQRRQTMDEAERLSLLAIQAEMKSKEERENQDRLAAIKYLRQMEEDERKGKEARAAKDKQLAEELVKMEQEEAQARKLKRQEEEKADFELAQKLMRELDDEKFAKDLERQMQKDDEKRRKALEESYKLAKRLHDEEEDAFKARIAEEKKKAELASGPGYWTTALGEYETYKCVPLDYTSELYGMVDQKFRESKRKMMSLSYVQNPTTWKRYVEAKRSTGIPEVYRFHGTPYTNVAGICQLGLLTSKDVSGRGTTIWSAENPSYSVGYSQKGAAPDGTLFMFLCRVLSRTATISTVQDSSHIWPEFIIAYK